MTLKKKEKKIQYTKFLIFKSNIKKIDKMNLFNCLSLKYEIIISKNKFINFAKNSSKVIPYIVFKISLILLLNIRSLMSGFDGDMDESST